MASSGNRAEDVRSGCGARVWDSGSRVFRTESDSVPRVWGFRMWGLGFCVSNLGFRISGFKFRVEGCAAFTRLNGVEGHPFSS